jgi:DNA-binding NarL/FixJ family response regulator
MQGEVMASRALALACLGRLDDARKLAMQASVCTQGIEARVLVPATDAVVALRVRESQVVDKAEHLVNVAFESGAVDILISTYRSSHDLLALLLSSKQAQERTVFAVARAGDDDLADRLGLKTSERLDPRESLSPRQREIHDLLVDRDIAKRLFISLTTVKAHVHHVYDKTGIRSRTALALNAKARQSQAASAATSDAAEGE